MLLLLKRERGVVADGVRDHNSSKGSNNHRADEQFTVVAARTAVSWLRVAVDAIDSGKYDMIVLNFANPDMVGHTGVLPAAIKAVETVDAGLGRIVEALNRSGGALLVTADHGNAEMMRDPATGGPHTAHTLNRVPVMLQGGPAHAMRADGRLADVAPTLLALLGLPQPAAMTGQCLLR
jgi:2,3-bisphosphoglycerate-independent phosphoglycerate mutase